MRQQRTKQLEHSLMLPKILPVDSMSAPSTSRSGSALPPTNPSHVSSSHVSHAASNPRRETDSASIEARIGYLEELLSRISQDSVASVPKSTAFFWPSFGQSTSHPTPSPAMAESANPGNILHKTRVLGHSNWLVAMPLVSQRERERRTESMARY